MIDSVHCWLLNNEFQIIIRDLPCMYDLLVTRLFGEISDFELANNMWTLSDEKLIILTLTLASEFVTRVPFNKILSVCLQVGLPDARSCTYILLCKCCFLLSPSPRFTLTRFCMILQHFSFHSRFSINSERVSSSLITFAQCCLNS